MPMSDIAKRIASRHTVGGYYTNERKREISHGINDRKELAEDRQHLRDEAEKLKRLRDVVATMGTHEEQTALHGVQNMWDVPKDIRAKYIAHLTPLGYAKFKDRGKYSALTESEWEAHVRGLDAEHGTAQIDKSAQLLARIFLTAAKSANPTSTVAVKKLENYGLLRANAEQLSPNYPSDTYSVTVGRSSKLLLQWTFLVEGARRPIQIPIGILMHDFSYWSDKVYVGGVWETEGLPIFDPIAGEKLDLNRATNSPSAYQHLPTVSESAPVCLKAVHIILEREVTRLKPATKPSPVIVPKAVVDSAVQVKIDILDKLIAKGFAPAVAAAQKVKDAYLAGGKPTDDDLRALRNMMYRSGMKPEADHFRAAALQKQASGMVIYDPAVHRITIDVYAFSDIRTKFRDVILTGTPIGGFTLILDDPKAKGADDPHGVVDYYFMPSKETTGEFTVRVPPSSIHGDTAKLLIRAFARAGIVTTKRVASLSATVATRYLGKV